MVERSLLTKLMGWLSAAMVLIAMIVAFANYRIAANELQEKFTHDSQTMIELTNSSLLEAVFAYDFQQIEAIAKSLVNTSLITGINIVDHRGKALATAQDAQLGDGQVPHTAIPIVYNGSNIGSYDITFSTHEVDQVLSSQVKNNILVVVLLLLASLGTVYVLTRRLVLAPVAEVTQSLASIADGGGDLTRRLSTARRDEIAALAHNFNRVMEHIADIIRNVVQVNDKVRDHVRDMAAATDSTVTSTGQQLNQIE